MVTSVAGIKIAETPFHPDTRVAVVQPFGVEDPDMALFWVGRPLLREPIKALFDRAMFRKFRR